mgnify:CR=1 FL=1
MYAIEASNLYKKFGDIVAVDHVSFVVKKGEVFGLLGPNGAGKTTTIRILTGILKPDEGIAKVMGIDIHREPIKAKSLIGVVPEEANPYPDLTVRDNLTLVGMLYGLTQKDIKGKMKDLLKTLGLYEVYDRKAKALSKGIRQRLLIAMALISEPQVLFLDEPTSGLDVISARKIRYLIRSLAKAGVTVFLTTHNIEEAGAICDRVAIINKGQIVALGNPDELKIKASKHVYLLVVFNKPLKEGELAHFLDPYEYRVEGRRLSVICEDLEDIVERLLSYVKSSRVKIVSIRTSRPSFEEVFLRLVRR